MERRERRRLRVDEDKLFVRLTSLYVFMTVSEKLIEIPLCDAIFLVARFRVKPLPFRVQNHTVAVVI